MSPSVAQEIQRAIEHHGAARYAEAESIYCRLIDEDPNCAGAIHLLGVLRAQQSKFNEAISLIRRAIALSPKESAFHSNLAQAYLEAREPEQAMLAARRSLQLNPNDAMTLKHLGNSLRALGRLEEGIAALQAAVRQRTNFVEGLQELSIALREAGRADEAIKCLEQAARVNPTDKRNEYFLAGVLQAQRRFSEAIAAYERAVAAGCEPLECYTNLGGIYQDLREYEKAADHARKAIEIDGSQSGPYNNLGLALSCLGRTDDAIEALHRALQLRVDNVEAWNNLGNAELDRLNSDRALAAYEKALYFRPDDVDAHWNRSLIWLMTAQWTKGWLEYEWRWKRFKEEKRTFAPPQWDGADIAGKSIFLHAEQGLGDAIQFVRYAPRLASSGATVHVECQPALVPLLKTVAGVTSVIAKGDPPPPFDVHCPLLSLPYATGMKSLDDIPADVPYVHADPTHIEQWSVKLGEKAAKRIGLAWAGATIHLADRARSLSLEKLSPLLGLKHVQWISLQKQVPPSDEQWARQLGLIDHTRELTDFAQTAALVANLDLVVTVDTAVAHLAGAMGKAVWILLPFKPDWRWMLEREETPWYPTARLFRQPSRGDWDDVIARVVGELKTKFE